MKTTEAMLNFQKIEQQVMQFVYFTLSADYVANYLNIETDYDKVRELHAYTRAFYDVQAKIERPNLSPLHSFTAILQKIKIGATFSPQEALQVAYLYDNAGKLGKRYHVHDDDVATRQIKTITDMFIANKTLVKEIKRVVTKDALIADDASSDLKANRIAQKETESAIRTTLARLLQSEKTKLAEHLYTVRNGRYVLPIKAEFKNTFAGILHDESASGTTAYIEPQTLVKMNNKLQTLRLGEAQEIERILQKLSAQITAADDEIRTNADAVARFDLYQAKAVYAYKYDMSAVDIVPKQQITLYDAKHPLLAKEAAVGNDILIGNGYNTLMITGANTGGKSVFLKTVGLLSLMAQAGLFLPVARDKDNSIGVFSQLFLAIGDEQSLEANLSTFSGHIASMKHILAESDDKSLILLDEIGTGTDPVQGAALAIAMIEHLAAKKALIIGTTHFNEVKAFIMEADFAENASMIFDLATLKPTFKIRYGSFGSSYAFDIATALALPQPIIERARTHAETFAHESDELLTRYEQRLQALDEQTASLADKEHTLAVREAALAAQEAKAIADIERTRAAVVQQSEQKAAKKLKQADTLLETIKQQKELKQNEYAQLKGELNKLQTSETPKDMPANQKAKKAHTFAPGDVVFVEQVGRNGHLVKKQGESWQVKVGKLTMTLRESELNFVKKGQQQKKAVKHVRKQASNISDTLDLRGFRVHEAIDTLQTYLANAASVHTVVRIIHGHGTGQVRDAVQETLRQTKTVKSFRFGGQGEGGVGATIVEFR